MYPFGISVIDATGKPGSGIMEGNFMWLGSFTECMDTVATQKQPDKSTKYLFKGQYCLASFLPRGPPRQVQGVITFLNIGVTFLCKWSFVSHRTIWGLEDLNNSQ